MNQAELRHILEEHKKWLNGEGGKRANLNGEDLRGTNLRGEDLRGADLSEADLRGTNLDYSCLPLWCGSLTTHFDDRQLIQIAYHLVKAGLHSKNASSETKAELSKLIDFANRFHRVRECGRIEVQKEWDMQNSRRRDEVVVEQVIHGNREVE